MTTLRKLPMQAPMTKATPGKNHGKAAAISAKEARFIGKNGDD